MPTLLASLLFLGSLSVTQLMPDVRELLEQAERAEASGNPQQAADLYRQALDYVAGPTARRAEARLTWLTARSEDGYRPLVALMTAQALDRTSPSVERLQTFAAEIDLFPQGRVRREARAFVAGALSRMGDDAGARKAYAAWLAEPDLDGADRRLAASGKAAVEIRQGSVSEGLSTLRENGLGPTSEFRQLRALQFSRAGQPIAIAVLSAFAIISAVALILVSRARRWGEVLSGSRISTLR